VSAVARKSKQSVMAGISIARAAFERVRMEPAAVLRRLRRAVWVAIGSGVLAAAASAAPVNKVGPGRPLSTTAANPDVAGAISDVVLRTVASGLGAITSIANAGDPKLYLTLRKGQVVVWDGARVRKRAFLDLSNIVSSAGDRGLLSLAFHPHYASNGIFFVSYTDKAGGLVVARYKRAPNSERADPASGVVLLTIAHPEGADHHGGQLQFGPDEDLYIGVGDGGSLKSAASNAQRDDVLLGKILRLDVDAQTTRPPYYGIPPSNPFVGEGPPLDEIWAKGLRDPWRFSFDRQTGDLYIGDVGERDGQVIDFQLASSRGGENYGRQLPKKPPVSNARPSANKHIAKYGSQYGDCAVVGGYVYRGSSDPRLSGIYFYGDYCSGRIWAGSRSWPGGQLTNATAPNLTTFGEDSSGELYVGTETGTLYRIVSPLPVPHPPTRAAAPEAPVEEPAEVAPVEAAAAVPEFLAQAPAPASEPIVDSSASVVYIEPPPEYPVQDLETPEAAEPPPPPDTTPPPAPSDRQNVAPVVRQVPPTRDVKPHN
jgi:glucose/arabinose dehydrogenase